MNFVLFLLLLPLIKPMRTGTNVVCGVHYMTQFKSTASKDEKNKKKTGQFTGTISLWKRAAKTASTTGKPVLVFWMRQIRAREISFTIWSKLWYQTLKKSCSDCTHASETTMLTYVELLGVKQFARLVLLQLVGFVHIWSQWALPVYPSLAEALSI